MLKKDYFYIGAVLDRSGSMDNNDKIVEARSGFNNLINERKCQDKRFDVHITIFDDKIETLFDGNINDCPELNEENFFARGWTKLYDAMGSTINKIGEILSKKPEHERPEKVIIVIITDGEENRSEEFTRETLSKIVKNQSEKYSWEFMFMGASEQSVLDAKKIGINNAASYADNARGVKSAYTLASRGIKGITG